MAKTEKKRNTGKNGRTGAVLIGICLFLFWVVLLGILFISVHRDDSYYNILYDLWFWISLLIVIVLSWVVENLSYRAAAEKRRIDFFSGYLGLKRRIAGDRELSAVYEERKRLPDEELKDMVSDETRSRKEYGDGMFRTHDGLAMISVFNDAPPALSRSERRSALKERLKGGLTEEGWAPLEDFGFELSGSGDDGRDLSA